jgi:hypothetical protein
VVAGITSDARRLRPRIKDADATPAKMRPPLERRCSADSRRMRGAVTLVGKVAISFAESVTGH